MHNAYTSAKLIHFSKEQNGSSSTDCFTFKTESPCLVQLSLKQILLQLTWFTLMEERNTVRCENSSVMLCMTLLKKIVQSVAAEPIAWANLWHSIRTQKKGWPEFFWSFLAILLLSWKYETSYKFIFTQNFMEKK